MLAKLLLLFVLMAPLLAPVAYAGPDDEDYFKQFLFHRDPVGSDPDYPAYVYWLLDSDYPSRVPIGNNKELILMTSFEFNSDHTYKMRYTDGIGDVGSDTWYPRNCKATSGTWSVPTQSLILKDAAGIPFLQGDRLLKDGKNEVLLTYLPTFPVAELRGQQTSYGMAQSQTDPLMTCMFPNH